LETFFELGPLKSCLKIFSGATFIIHHKRESVHLDLYNQIQSNGFKIDVQVKKRKNITLQRNLIVL
jgi:hypothetical protein